MKSRWLINLVLLAVVASGGLALYFMPKKGADAVPEFRVSSVLPGSVTAITIEFPARARVELQKRGSQWFLVQPIRARASGAAVGHILSLLEASTRDKLAADNLALYDLDRPVMKLRLDQQEFLFGTSHPLDQRQYVAHGGAVYLLPSLYFDVASTQVGELIDKSLLTADETIAGFDFSRLEQWEKTGLRMTQENGQWTISAKAAKPNQKELGEWLRDMWKGVSAVTVEPYKPDRRTVHPSFEVLLKNGKTVHFDKIQESPELLLGRPDEGMLYHLPADLGFGLLNPPVGFQPE